MSAPAVTIAMPMYDAEPFVDEAVRSVLAQTRTDWELIVVDDASRDRSREVVAARTSDPRIRLLSLSHGGPARARNAALREARGASVAFLDADDAWTPDHLERMTAALEARPGRFVYSNATTVGAGEPAPVHGPDYVPAASFRDLYVATHVVSPGAFAARREDLIACDGFPEDPAWIGSEDRALYLALAARGVLPAYLPHAGLRYRQHPAQLTKDRSTFLKAKLAVRAAFRDATAGDPPVRLISAEESGRVLSDIAYDLAYALLDADFPASASAYAQALAFDPRLATDPRAKAYARKRRRARVRRLPIVGPLLARARRTLRSSGASA